MKEPNFGLRMGTIADAISEARRFIMAAEKAVNRIVEESKESRHSLHFRWTGPTMETAALRRASMDLTRKLADLRLGR